MRNRLYAVGLRTRQPTERVFNRSELFVYERNSIYSSLEIFTCVGIPRNLDTGMQRQFVKDVMDVAFYCYRWKDEACVRFLYSSIRQQPNESLPSHVSSCVLSQ